MTTQSLEHIQTSFELPLLPLKNVVILPRSILPILVGRGPSIAAVEAALKGNRELFITAQKDQTVENPVFTDLFAWGTKATILQVTRMPKGALKILVEGMGRALMESTSTDKGYMSAYITDIKPHPIEKPLEIEALWRHIQQQVDRMAQLNTKVPADLLAPAKTLEDIEWVADTLPLHVTTTLQDRQDILQTSDLAERLLLILKLLKKEVDILETEERIKGRVQHQVEKNQREYYLGEQLKAIHKELGREDQSTELQQLRTKAKQLALPAEAADRFDREIKRLEQMPPLSAEGAVSRNYIEWILSLPWHKVSRDSISIEQAQKILDKSHEGLKKVKERIIEFLAARKFAQGASSRSPVICLVGPPGVGKTSLAHAIAESLGREFVRISLGGVRDEAEIRGHRRTYIGALPGKIIQAMRKAKTMNPVILLDEIDKMSQDSHGDPGAALLEVLDPEQNKAFVDHFLELEYDLSKVMFIATANHIDGIPYPLFDRMETIQLAGYTDHEKLAIAQTFLLPKNRKELGLKSTLVKIDTPVLRYLMHHYTKEAGVRQLDRVIARILRKAIQKLLEGTQTKVVITQELLIQWLGQPKYNKATAEKLPAQIGLATGLAWTELGGDVLEVEVAVVSGKGGVTLTGQLGEVMQESAHAALSYIRLQADRLSIKPTFTSNKDIHIHVPEGATPKDGPSAGITICTALVSAVTKIAVNPHVAMTGEITLRGRVLGVGGLKEKLLAAAQHGFTTVIVPAENKDDIAEFQADIPSNLQLVYAHTMDEVLTTALVKSPFTRRMSKTSARKNNSSKTTAKKD